MATPDGKLWWVHETQICRASCGGRNHSPLFHKRRSPAKGKRQRWLEGKEPATSLNARIPCFRRVRDWRRTRHLGDSPSRLAGSSEERVSAPLGVRRANLGRCSSACAHVGIVAPRSTSTSPTPVRRSAVVAVVSTAHINSRVAAASLQKLF